MTNGMIYSFERFLTNHMEIDVECKRQERENRESKLRNVKNWIESIYMLKKQGKRERFWDLFHLKIRTLEDLTKTNLKRYG